MFESIFAKLSFTPLTSDFVELLFCFTTLLFMNSNLAEENKEQKLMIFHSFLITFDVRTLDINSPLTIVGMIQG